VCLNDDVVEGLELRDASGALKAFSVQYHPEAAAGPHDAAYLFDRFIDLMEGTRDGRTANLSKEPVDSAHPAATQKTDNKTEDNK
jgi:carbamoyl-phosphate synthase small subunit